MTSVVTTTHYGEQVVLFLDLLGFAALTADNLIDENGLRQSERILGLDSFDMLRWSENELTRTFRGFHFTLKSAIDLASMRHRLTAITFSDSAFIATDYLNDLANIAGEIARNLLLQRIPVRMGVAWGSFAALRFRSDVTAEGGEHAAQFLGTGVVNAHAAESCGIKGIRLLLHPSVMWLREQKMHTAVRLGQQELRVIPCHESELGNRAAITHELNYWSFGRTAEVRAWHALQDMWTAAPFDVHHHYRATAEAINRMRMTQGAKALSNLRRRRLP